MSYLPKGRHYFLDPDHPKAAGICDKTQFIYPRDKLVKQMEWRGNALVWTGFLVGPEYADVPNEQLRPPILQPDPVPVQNPRLDQMVTSTPASPPAPNYQVSYVILNEQTFETATPTGFVPPADNVPGPTLSYQLLNQTYFG